MNELLLLLFSAIAEVLIAYQLFSHFFFQKYSSTIKVVLISVALIIVLTLTSALQIFLFNTCMSLLIYILYILLLFKCKWWQAILWPVVFVLLGMASEIATSFSVSYAFDVHIQNTMIMTWYKLIVYIISKSILYILVRIITTLFSFNKKVETDRTSIFLISFPILAILNEHLLVRLTMQLDLSRGIMAVSMIIGIGLILAGFFIIILYDRELQKKQLENALLLAQSKAEANEKIILLQEQNLAEARSTVHDFNNQLLNIKALYEEMNSEAAEYHKELMDSLKRQMNRQSIDVNNRVFSNILMRVQTRCEQLSIKFESHISYYDLGFIDPVDTSTIFDNAFDNAIQASVEIVENNKRWISFKLYKSTCFLICEIANSYTKPIKTNMGEFVSSKDDKKHHGIGIKRIQSTVYKYGGDILCSYNNSEFHLSIRISTAK